MACLKNTVRSKATAVGNAFSEKWLWSLTILVHSSHKFMLLLHSICFTLSKQYKCNLNILFIHHLNFPYIALKASLPFKQLHKTQSPFCNKANCKRYLIPAGCSLSWLRIIATLRCSISSTTKCMECSQRWSCHLPTESQCSSGTVPLTLGLQWHPITLSPW